MHQQVRITADRRGEVGVGLVVETEVAIVVGAVHRLTQRAQHHGLDQVEVRTLLDGLQQGLVILRRGAVLGLLATLQRQSQLAEEGAQLFQALRRRAVVHAVQRRDVVILHEARGGHVGGQHALLDQLVRVIALGRADLGDLAPGAEDDARLLGLEVDGTALVAGRQQHLEQRVELLEVRHDIGVLATQLLGLGGLRLLEDGADLVVGQPRVGMDHRLVELVVDQLAGLREAHLADHRQAIDVRVQRAQAVGQLLRQHRHHALGEVHRVAALLRLVIQRRADLDVVRHVGDRHIELPATGEQLPAAAVLLAIDGIVEVAGILAIDGDEWQVAQIDALFLVLLLDFRPELARLLDHRFRPDVGNVVAAQGDVDFHARRHIVADHLDDVALRLEARGRPVGDLDLDELADLGAGGPPRGDQHFLLHLGVVRGDEADAAFLEVATDHALVGALEHLDDGTLAAAAAVKAGNPCEHDVAVEHQAHLPGAEEQVVAAVVRHQEAEAVTMAADAPTDQVELVHRGVGATAGIDKLAIAFHGAQAPPQRLDLLFFAEAKLFQELLTTRGRAAFGEVMQDQLTAGDGVVVFFRFTRGLGIEGLPIGHLSGVTYAFALRSYIY
ncbi:hypothetical protein D9M70_403880 [compost metagenome]